MQANIKYLLLITCVYLSSGIKAQQALEVGDSIMLNVDGYISGRIQWQLSTDNKKWYDIDGQINNTYFSKIYQSAYYRASVSQCEDDYFSDTVFIATNVSDGIKKSDFDFIDNIGKYLSSDLLKGRFPGTNGDTLTINYISDIYSKIGLIPVPGKDNFIQNFITNQELPTANVLGMIPGADSLLKDEIVVVSAHFDHKGVKNGEIYNGADDNATGVASMCLLANNFKNEGFIPKRTIVFLATGSEEFDPYLQGMKYFINSKIVENQKMQYGLNFDMIGRLRKDTLYFYGQNTTEKLVNFINQENTDHLNVVFSGEPLWPHGLADQYALSVLGFPCFTFTTGREPEYHTPSDDWKLVNLPELLKVVGLSYRVLKLLSSE